MSLTGSDPAKMYALGGVARGGATRGGYIDGRVYISIAGQQYGFAREAGDPGIVLDSLTIADILDETPNRCAFRVNGPRPPAGEVIITLGSQHSLTRQFAGFLRSMQQRYAADNPRFVQSECSCVDYAWLLSFVKVTARYQNASGTIIARDLVTRFGGANGFTARNVIDGLPSLEEITFTNEDLGDALTRLARRLGAYWYTDYHKDVHLFFEEVRNGAPVPLTPAHRSLAVAGFQPSSDGTQVLTRIYVEGRGAKLLGPVSVGETKIPLDTVAVFTPAADVFLKVAPQGSEGGAQHLTFAAAVPSPGGSLVGPGVGPPGAPTVAGAAGAGLTPGRYQYAYTDITAGGETLPSPLATIDVGGLLAPPTTPVVATPELFAGGVEPAARGWTYTNVAADGGETTGGPGAGATTQLPLTPSGGIYAYNDYGGGPLPSSTWFGYKVTYVGNISGETTAAPSGASVFTGSLAPNHKIEIFIQNAPPGTTAFNVYRTPGGASSAVVNGPYYYVGTGTVYPDGAGNFMDTTATLGALLPTTNTAQAKAGKVTITGIAPGPAGTVSRKLYRSRADGIRLVATIADNTTTTYIDTTPDAGLGALLPTVNTAGAGLLRVQVSNIATGPTAPVATTARKVYRTIVNGAQLKLLTTLADNLTTTYLDAVADAALGANAPAGDTSGLTQPAGQVPAGSSSIIVANAGIFEAAGGWAVIGNGEQVIRYTGKAGASLTGVPAAGIGAIVAAVAYNSTITAAPMLTGVPAAGERAIVTALPEGTEVYQVVQVDDAARQAQLAAVLGVGPGIREEWIQDRRLSTVEARARGLATLALRPLTQQSVRYRCRDLRTAAGKTIAVDLPPPTNISGSFKIQAVTISNFRPHANQYPTFTVEASSSRFTFEDFLRRMNTKE